MRSHFLPPSSTLPRYSDLGCYSYKREFELRAVLDSYSFFLVLSLISTNSSPEFRSSNAVGKAVIKISFS